MTDSTIFENKKIAFQTLGCKLNFAETSALGRQLKEIGFDYIALGHIHKRTEQNKYNFIYPGSMISFGFDELGEHGMLDIIIEKNNIENKLNKINYSENIKNNFATKRLLFINKLVSIDGFKN